MCVCQFVNLPVKVCCSSRVRVCEHVQGWREAVRRVLSLPYPPLLSSSSSPSSPLSAVRPASTAAAAAAAAAAPPSAYAASHAALLATLRARSSSACAHCSSRSSSSKVSSCTIKAAAPLCTILCSRKTLKSIDWSPNSVRWYSNAGAAKWRQGVLLLRPCAAGLIVKRGKKAVRVKVQGQS